MPPPCTFAFVGKCRVDGSARLEFPQRVILGGEAKSCEKRSAYEVTQSIDGEGERHPVPGVIGHVWRPAAAEDDWQAWTVEAASRLRDFLAARPAALHVYLAHPVVSQAAVDRMNAMMRVLRQAGIDEESARSAYGAVHTYTIGFAALEASRARRDPGSEDVSGLARQLAAYTTTGQFAEGLRYLLEGISGHADPRQGDRADREPGT